MDGSTHTRAAFLRGAGLDRGTPLQRPPWTDEGRIRAHCTSCAACLDACPEAILIAGPAGTPVVDFSKDACSFCGACADACKEEVFAATDTPPWDLFAAIGTRCLLTAGISCRTCTDACDTRALKFDYRGGPAGRILIDAEACTGCGGCLSVCPTGAITLISDKTEAA